MTATQNPTTTLDYEGREVPLPGWCPPWCDTNHAEYAAEAEGTMTAEEITRHHGWGAQHYTPTEHNSVSGRLQRPGGASWDLEVRQGVRDPFDPHAGYNGPPLVHVRLTDTERTMVDVQLTTGEVRVLAAQMLALCDRVDLGEITRPARAFQQLFRTSRCPGRIVGRGSARE